MEYKRSSSVQPRIIIHGGAGNISRENLPEKSYNAYRNAMLEILGDAYTRLRLQGATALDVATYAVSRLENNGLFNSGHGAVYTTAGTHELEASVMVSRGYRKRGVGVMKVTRVKNPILLAREMLVRGEEEDGGGAQGHCQLEGKTCDRLAEEWGLEMVEPSYFWTRRRWDEHRRGLGKRHDGETYREHKRKADQSNDSMTHEHQDEPVSKDEQHDSHVDDIGWDGSEYLPQGTVGAVVLDDKGTACAATSTGGLTNKLPGRIGDTPTLGAGFWAEEWSSTHPLPICQQLNSSLQALSDSLSSLIGDCIPSLSGYAPLPQSLSIPRENRGIQRRRAVAMSGTGNGDSFLRLSAVRTAAAIARFSQPHPHQSSAQHSLTSLQQAVSTVAGPKGMLQQSAEDRWLKTGEGEGGIIGVEFVNGKGEVVFDFNCGGMFHAWVDEGGRERFGVFQDETET